MTSSEASAPAAATPGLRAARFSLYAIGLMWLLPFLQPVHRYPLSSFRSEWLAVVLGMIALVPLVRRDAWNEFRLPIITLFPLAFLPLLLLQGALGMLPYAAQFLTPALYLIWAMFLIVLAARLRQAIGLDDIVLTLAGVLVVGGVLNALAGYVQHFDGSGVLGGLVSRKNAEEVYGNLAQRNHYANYLVLAIVSLVYLFAKRRISLRALSAGALFMLPALAMSGSRSAWLYFGVLLALTGSVRLCGGAVERSRIAAAMFGVVALFVGAQWLVTLPLFASAPLTTAGQRLFEESAAGSIRLQLWREALVMFAQSPWLGIGFGNFAWHHFLQQAQAPVTVVDGLFNNAHNVALHVLAETGIGGFAMLAAAAMIWTRGLSGCARSLERWWITAVVVVIAIHSLLEHPLWYAYFLGIFAVLLGLGSTYAYRMKSAAIGRWVVIGALAAGGFNAVVVLKSVLDLERAVATRALVSPEERARYTRAFVDGSRDPLLEPYADFGLSTAIEASLEKVREKLYFNERVMHLAPTARVVYTQAILLALSGDVVHAQQLFRQAMAVYPNHLPTVVSELQTLSRRYPGRVDALLESAISEKGKR